MIRHLFRSFVNVLLIFTMLGMAGPRLAMALPMGMAEMTHHTNSLHGHMQNRDDKSSRHAIAQAGHHNGQHILCDCAASGCFCAACHAVVPTASAIDFSDGLTVPASPADLNLADITIPLDPPPPRV